MRKSLKILKRDLFWRATLVIRYAGSIGRPNYPLPTYFIKVERDGLKRVFTLAVDPEEVSLDGEYEAGEYVFERFGNEIIKLRHKLELRSTDGWPDVHFFKSC